MWWHGVVDRSTRLTCSTRSAEVGRAPEAVRAVLASGRPGCLWYVDAAPFVFRGAVDRLVGGGGRRWAAPDRALLETGDRVGFWEVRRSGVEGLALRAAVRAPGTVDLDVGWEAAGPSRTHLTMTVCFTPEGLAGLAYLLADLPARETVAELTFRRILRDLS
jgi:hypothetical protein